MVSCIFDSGGPLLDSKGNLIGINTAIFTQTGNVHPSPAKCHFNVYSTQFRPYCNDGIADMIFTFT